MLGGRRQANREQRREDRKEFGVFGTARRYKMRQKLVSFGDDFWIENQAGERVYKVDGKMLRVRDTLFFEDAQGNQLCKIQTRVMRIKDTMEIEGPGGERLALVRKALIAPLRDRFVVKIGDGPDLDVQGNIINHQYRISEGNNQVAEVSKKWFRVRDTYGVQVEEGRNEIVLLAITVAIDMMAHG